MNVCFTFTKNVLLYCLLLALPSLTYAQLEQYELIADESFEYVLASSPNSPSANANHGDATTSYIGNLQYKIIYTPDEGFIGLDTLTIGFWESFQYRIKGIEIVVIPSKVIAENDYATTNANQAIEIEVVANDYSSRGYLELSGIPLFEHGFAAIESPTTVVFIPNQDFDGLARFNYTVCDDIGTCATATVNISVIGNSPPSPQDTVYVSTTKNNSLPIPLNYPDYQVDSYAANGSVFLDQNLVEYDPNTNYTGGDEFILKRVQNGLSFYKIFIVDVLTTQNPNGVAFDDFAYTPTNTPVDINVANNDIGNYNIKSFTQSHKGEVLKINSKTLRYIPEEDFEGLINFTYRIKAGGVDETATVYVTVDNQNPGEDEYHFSTQKNIPKPIFYDVPIDQFNFSIADQADFGIVDFYEGQVDTMIYGQHIVGQNIVVYTPFVDYVGTDEFEIMYCVPANGGCDVTKIIMTVTDMAIPDNYVCISSDCVWPGDGNNDGIVNMVDLLHLGYNFGDIGEYRSNASLLWYGQFADDWNKSTIPGLDAKYADMNGDGIVASDDLAAMDSCYNLTHALTPEFNPFEKNSPLRLVPTSSPPYNVGDVVSFDIVLGTPENPAIDIYGITAAFDYDLRYANGDEPVISFYEDSWFSLNSPVLNLVKAPYKGRLDFGITRTNGFTASGYGTIGTINYFIVDDDIAGFKTHYPTITVHSIVGMDAQANYFQLAASSVEMPIDINAPKAFSTADLNVYPNPTSSVLNIHLNGQNKINAYALYSLTGQLIMQKENQDTKQATLAVKSLELSTGMYILRVQTEKGPITKKVYIQNRL